MSKDRAELETGIARGRLGEQGQVVPVVTCECPHCGLLWRHEDDLEQHIEFDHSEVPA